MAIIFFFSKRHTIKIVDDFILIKLDTRGSKIHHITKQLGVLHTNAKILEIRENNTTQVTHIVVACSILYTL